MTVTLRDYQVRAVDGVRASFRSGHRCPLLVMPTGGGKTICFSHIAQGVASLGKRVLILVHRQELLLQASEKLGDVPHGLIKAGITPRISEAIQVASVQTLVQRLHKQPYCRPELGFDLIIIDECHHSVAETYLKILRTHPAACIIGVTATPVRSDGKGLGDIFDDLVEGPSTAELIAAGHLCPPEVYAPSIIDTTGVHTRRGDFDRAELAAASDKPTITGDAIDHYRRLAHGEPAIAFCVSVKHAEHVAEAFRLAGYSARMIDGTTDDTERKAAIADLGAGRLQVLTTCDLISEGVDVPVVSVGIMLRPTQSMGLSIQQMGRVLRPAPGKQRALILDHAGNCMKHGLPTTPREWSLEKGVVRPKKKKEEQAVQVSYCDRCYHIFARAQQCPKCGHVVSKAREIEQREGELKKLTDADFAKAQRQEVGKARTYEELVAIGHQRGYERPQFWARKVIEGRGGRVVQRGESVA